MTAIAIALGICFLVAAAVIGAASPPRVPTDSIPGSPFVPPNNHPGSFPETSPYPDESAQDITRRSATPVTEAGRDLRPDPERLIQHVVEVPVGAVARIQAGLKLISAIVTSGFLMAAGLVALVWGVVLLVRGLSQN